MTIEQAKLFHEGASLWGEYVRVNGYSWSPNRRGLEKLAKLLDLTVPWIQKRINFYLES